MATKIDELKWNLYLIKWEILWNYGVKRGLIHTYEQELIENLRHTYYGGVPASIMLLCRKMCAGKCYDRALLVTFGFGDDDFRLVDADIDSITLNPEYVGRKNKHYGNHCFAERTKKDGTTWVYDTTAGLVIEKNLYYLMQRPKIIKINSKQATQDSIEYQEIKNAGAERDKYTLPMILPNIELIANAENDIYSQALKEEITRFKQEIGYDAIAYEIDQDMKQKGIGR